LQFEQQNCGQALGHNSDIIISSLMAWTCHHV
jgi:hypothetical protein